MSRANRAIDIFSLSVRYGAANVKKTAVFDGSVEEVGSAVEGQLECVDKTIVCPISDVQMRNGVISSLYVREDTGISYRCDVLDRLDRYMMDEDSSVLSRAEINAFNALIAYEDGSAVDEAIVALDDALVAMVMGVYNCYEVSNG